MWRDIFLNNREAVLEIVERFTEDLTALQRAIRWGEGDKLRSSLPAPARSVVRSSRRSRPERARRTYSQVIRGTLPSFAGPRNICPFWIVNAVLISGLPSGPALASKNRAVGKIQNCRAFIGRYGPVQQFPSPDIICDDDVVRELCRTLLHP